MARRGFLWRDRSQSIRKYMRAFAAAWSDPTIAQLALRKLPWGQNLALLDKLNDFGMRLWYARECAKHGWSRSILELHIERRLHEQFDAETMPPKKSGGKRRGA